MQNSVKPTPAGVSTEYASAHYTQEWQSSYQPRPNSHSIQPSSVGNAQHAAVWADLGGLLFAGS